MNLWIIEARDEAGKLDFRAPQPESVFGNGAITGLTEDAMSAVIFRRLSDAELGGGLRGDNIARWPTLIDARWIARRKTW